MFFQALTYFSIKSKLSQLRALFAAFAFFILSLTAQQISAATMTVVNTADSGAGSLRQAVLDANATTAADTINFAIPTTDANCDANGVCTITLSSGVITIPASGGSLTISNQTGAGKLRISGNNANRIFEAGVNANLTLDGLTITNGVGAGNAGGQINGVIKIFRASFTLMNSIVTQNTGTPAISVEAFGSAGTMTVINTTVSNNTGHGIFFSNGGTNGGSLDIVNSTINNNAANSSTENMGGGLWFGAAHLRMTNSTVSGNVGSTGGIYMVYTPSSDRSIVLTNCTITANRNAYNAGGGIEIFSAGMKLRNTIVSGNTNAGGASDIRYWNAAITSLGNNLIGTATVQEAGDAQWLPSDLLNRNVPQLAPLANNGGLTQTHALLPNSPAINAGNNCVLTANGCGDNNPAVPTDQRGAVRAGTVDIGAYEATRRPSFDFDGDGKSDVAVFRPSDGVWYRLNSSNNSFNAVQFGASTDLIAPADYDGDGKTDVAVFRPGAFAYFYIIDSSTNTFRYSQFGTTNDVPLAGDYDGDGKADLAVYREGTQSNFYVRPTSFPNVDYTTITLGTTGDKPLYGDFDGDRKLDHAVFRPSNATWYIVRSSAAQLTQTIFGLAADIPVPADYDGDGQTNIAVFRPSNGTWYTNQNASVNYGAVVFGTSGDVPVPTDYDGDGRADVAVFRPSNGAWYLQRSTAGFTGVAFGDVNDKPIPNAFIR